MKDRWKKIISSLFIIPLEIITLLLMIFIFFGFFARIEISIEITYFIWFLIFLISILFDVITYIRKKILWKKQNIEKYEIKGATFIYAKNIKGIPIFLLDTLLFTIQEPIFLALLFVTIIQSIGSPFYVPLLIIIASIVSYSTQTKKPFRTMKWLTIGVIVAFFIIWFVQIIEDEIASPVSVLWIMVILYFIFKMGSAFTDTT